ncbi:hypothetical protein ALC53_07319, partial [Atta colombica]
NTFFVLRNNYKYSLDLLPLHLTSFLHKHHLRDHPYYPKRLEISGIAVSCYLLRHARAQIFTYQSTSTAAIARCISISLKEGLLRGLADQHCFTSNPYPSGQLVGIAIWLSTITNNNSYDIVDKYSEPLSQTHSKDPDNFRGIRYHITKTWSDSSMGFVSVSPLRRSAGHIAGYYRNGDGGGVAGGSVVVLRRWLLEEEPREDHPVAYSIWTCNGSTTSPRTAMWPMRNESSSRHVTLSTTDRFGSARDTHARTYEMYPTY